jgi:putative bacteriocin precursor
MKKLNKKVNTQIGTLEAYYTCSGCPCGCYCNCGSAPDSVMYGGGNGAFDSGVISTTASDTRYRWV